MATDYSKKTNADLVEILKSRSLPHTGKKADLIARLQEDDSKNAGTAAAPAPAAKADVADDVIDWEDDEPTEGAADAAPKASTEAGAATIEAGGKGQASNPAAVPNQKLDENPAATSDLKVEATGGEAGQEGSEAAPAEGAGGDDQTAEKSDANYAKGLPITELEEELRKRKARAEKFGITEDSQASIADAEKQLDRAKRFGSGVAPDVGVKKLDEALPQEKSRKRGQHDNNDAGGLGGKRRHFGGRNRSRPEGGNRNRRDGGNNSSGRSNGQQTVVTEQERSALEARAKRFAAA